ncbi:MAG: diguanylate cyclase/phosphodiesterase (GGDEF & EAL domains) with PAS/PAC sensor(s) [uncultured Solirubrobacteraceae bacterium]|uniref:Diguanylate cyclase/phosphodiesterase (GGDEF & EAL domains) with PAS/PAC sensor(S) n=1 Tax=uncultured Solirubrobacteraceae bacterium TaxID=1162706 RepID=A0A6J4ST16_9ACTN|nr:MAG: diguanylate cyclase/phosphodiesterase (GGDEF & EAL domains) with PAS/PAC sensor(s) [uncultured Solirubrobacteraceae bacterium]
MHDLLSPSSDPLSAALAHRALDAAVTGIVIVDMTRPHRPMTYVNPAFERITGYRTEEVLGRNCRILQGEETDPAAVAEFSEALRRGEACRVTLRNYRADGTPFWNEVSLAPVRSADGIVTEYIGIQNDVTERVEAESRVQYLAFHDGLTGLANRHALQAALSAATDSARRRGTGLALLYVDLDDFKRINDSLGHAAGDELLGQVAGRLRELVRPGDVLARQGGDEFLILLDDLGRDAEALAGGVAARLIAALRKPFKLAGAQAQVGASVGVSLLPRDAADATTLLQHADAAMYRAKSRDGSRWALYGAPVEAGPAPHVPPPAPVARPSAPATSLDEILAGDTLRSVYQPLVELDTGEVVGYEALARGPEGTPFERPDRLFAAARSEGRLGELDWACRAAAVRGALEGGLPAPLRLFVNMEPEALGVPCPEHLRDLWARASELDVVVEVTERALTSRPADLLHSLEAFRELGWSVALDDVGADSRSLALMNLLHPDVIKLDLRLIHARPDQDIAEIVTAVNAYAERTGAVVLAEGLETDEHLAAAHAVGATHGQGWRFGRPGPLPAVSGDAPRALPVVPRPARAAGTTPFEVVGQLLPIRRATKPLLLQMTWHLERQARELGETALLLSAFQTAERFTPRTRERYAVLAERLAFVAGFGVGLDAEPAPGVRGATLGEDDALKDEWSVVVIAPHFAGALVAVDLGDEGPDAERRFDYALTYDRDLVMTAASSLMRRVQPLA